MLYKFVRGTIHILASLFYRFKIIGRENISDKGRMIICANHKHVFDPLFVAICTKRIIFFMAKKELFKGKMEYIMRKLNAIPVNRDGNDSYSLKLALKTLKDENVLGIFPEGTRSANKSGHLSFKPGVSMLSIKTKTKIVPVYIMGNYKIFSRMTAVIGEAFELNEYYDKNLTSDDYIKIANERIANSIHALKLKTENTAI